MKPIVLHPVSFLLGCALVGLPLVLTAAAQSPGVTHHPRTEVVGQIPAEWWTYVEVTQTQPFTVPADRYFVVTGIGDGYSASPNLFENGQVTTRLSIMVNSISGVGIDMNGTRVVFAPGTVLSQTYYTARTQLWGYLEPVQ